MSSQDSAFEEDGHLTLCSSVLVPCLYGCGVYLPRADVREHNRICPSKNRRIPMVNYPPYQITEMTHPARHTPSPRATQCQRANDIADLRELEERFCILEQKVFSMNGSQNNSNYQDVQYLKLQNQMFEQWKKVLTEKLELLRLKQDSTVGSSEQWDELRKRLVDFETLRIEFNKIKETLSGGEAKTRQNEAILNQKLSNVEERIAMIYSELTFECKDQQKESQDVQRKIVELQNVIDQQKAKFVAFNFDFKSLSNVATEAAEKVELQERRIEDMKKQLKQMKIDLEILEEKPETNLPIGRLLWRIVNVESRIKNARENDLVLKSPTFYTHEFGYKIRAHLFLNGLKKWEGRHCLMCLQVIKGEYDMTLKWPCDITGSVTLKDLENIEKPNNLTKVISAKFNNSEEETEDPRESSALYIFIPHEVLLKDTYLKDDTLFLDIRINQNKKLGLEIE